MMIHSLGTGETFEIAPASDGFVDSETGWRVRVDASCILLPSGPIEVRMGDDVGFSGFVMGSGDRFAGRAGGGSSVTIYDQDEYYQYAVVSENGI